MANGQPVTPGSLALTIPNLGPRPTPAASYFKRKNPPDNAKQEQPSDSDLLKSIKRVIRPFNPHHTRHSGLYPAYDGQSDEILGPGLQLSWSNDCVVLCSGNVILEKWTFEKEGQDIQWACKGFFLEPGGVVDGPTGSWSSTHSNDGGPSVAPSQSTFSRFAQNAQARQRVIEPPKRLQAVYVFLRNLGKIFVEGGRDYTFHIPFLVRGAWPLRPHGVLIQRDMGVAEFRDAARTRTPLLPTLFSLHDPFAEPKVIGIASKIHGALGPGPSDATAVTPLDPASPPETRTPEDYTVSGGYKPTPLRAMQTEAPPPPPKPERLPPLQKPPPTDRILWVSGETMGHYMTENLIVTCTLPVTYPPPPPAPSASSSQSPGPTSSAKAPPGHHRFSHHVHLTVWRYAYLKPREVPDPIPSRRTRPHAPPPTYTPDAGGDGKPPVAPTPQPRNPEAARRRELQDRADRIAPFSSDVSTPTEASFPPLPPGTSDAALPFAAPRQPLGAQPTLASLPGGELPLSWGHPYQPSVASQGHENKGSLARGRRPSLSVTMDRMAIDTAGAVPGETAEGGNDQKTEAETSTATFMSAGHMKMQPSVWLEKLSVLPMPYGE